MASFDLAIPVILAHEGTTYTDDPADPGGATRWGITLRTLRGVRPGATKEDVRNLTRPEAEAIYRRCYWGPFFDDIADQRVATKLFDMCVNWGVGAGVTALQVACRDAGHVIAVDGAFGPISVAAVNASPPAALLVSLQALMEVHYERWIAKDPKREKFRRGLMARARWVGDDASGKIA
jgi:lysozyme family protein